MNIGVVSLQLGAFASTAHAQDARERAMKAWMAYEQQDYPACAQLYAEAIEIGGVSEATYYNAACCFAQAGNPDQAFSYLHTAVAKGYKDVDHLRQDSDLAALQDDPRWTTTVEKVQHQFDAYLQTVNGELYELFRQDQSERMQEQIDWDALQKHDQERRQRVLQMLEEGSVQGADDHFHAAMILHHIDDSTSHRMARDLARQAAALDPASMEAKWLAAAAQDRYLWKIGKPQWYGTQFQQDSTGQWTLNPIDTTAVTDEERLIHGVPRLAETQQQLEQMNQHPGFLLPNPDENEEEQQDSQ